MARKSAFDSKKIATEAYSETSGVLDQLNLPPDVIRFLRKYQRIIWTVVIVVAVVVTTVSLYGSYRDYRREKATSALYQARTAPMEDRAARLAKVIEEFGSTPAALWARVEQAHLLRQDKKYPQAIQALEQVKARVKAKNPLNPLVLVELGKLQEQVNKLDQAMESYRQLATIQGFTATATYHQARIHDQRHENDQALELYQRYIALTEKKGRLGPDPLKTLVQSRINHLQQ